MWSGTPNVPSMGLRKIMKYFIGRMLDVDRPYCIYSSKKHYDTDGVAFRTDSYEKARSKLLELNKIRKMNQKKQLKLNIFPSEVRNDTPPQT